MIVAGFGFRAGATTASLRAALEQARTGGQPVTHLATLEDKAQGLVELASLLALPLVLVAPARVIGFPTLTQSLAAKAARGTGSVAEACALAAAGIDDARLLGPRSISPDRMATCAIAQGTST
ncbi:cobalamin biosynthesis protein [Sphingobium sp. BYY-5]|uniref:cobalamin biosynthesis protein n=1 Tax=Sphingobium sp. BYY-5 TaxID=2926400 RepID=UPI001FA7051F|nr:cobalamin biosynthesis protein [Sphingobium sp. BYY-5]